MLQGVPVLLERVGSRLSQSNIAELVGGNRSSINRVLERLQDQDLLLVRYGQLQILDGAGLAKVAGLA